MTGGGGGLLAPLPSGSSRFFHITEEYGARAATRGFAGRPRPGRRSSDRRSSHRGGAPERSGGRTIPSGGPPGVRDSVAEGAFHSFRPSRARNSGRDSDGESQRDQPAPAPSAPVGAIRTVGRWSVLADPGRRFSGENRQGSPHAPARSPPPTAPPRLASRDSAGPARRPSPALSGSRSVRGSPGAPGRTCGSPGRRSGAAGRRGHPARHAAPRQASARIARGRIRAPVRAANGSGRERPVDPFPPGRSASARPVRRRRGRPERSPLRPRAVGVGPSGSGGVRLRGAWADGSGAVGRPAGVWGLGSGCLSGWFVGDSKNPRAMGTGVLIWVREQDLNLRPSGYEPDELPGCSIPRQWGVMEAVRVVFLIR